jgi:hypothetical protein
MSVGYVKGFPPLFGSVEEAVFFRD